MLIITSSSKIRESVEGRALQISIMENLRRMTTDLDTFSPVLESNEHKVPYGTLPSPGNPL